MNITDKDKIYVYTKKADFNAVAESFGVDPVIARILRNRELVTDDEIRFFLHGDMSGLYDPMLLPDIEKASDIIISAINDEKNIRIVGDYDIDGVCATYILKKGLEIAASKQQKKKKSADISYVIPDRIKDGYGINMRIVNDAIRDKIDVIITCDNGISAFDELTLASESGIKVVLTDHHNVRTDENGNDMYPEALAVVDAKRSDSRYPDSEICGAVTAWKLIQVIYDKLNIEKKYFESFTEFAAIATIGDIMTLRGENRIIVKEGLRILNECEDNTGLKALIRCLDLKYKQIGVYHIGFIIGPCINAAGRLETADKALNLLLCEDDEEAFNMAVHLSELNESRKSLTELGCKDAFEQVENVLSNDNILVVYLPSLHESLAGIVAGRIKEKYYKPCFVLTESEDNPELLKGSGRSIEAWDMFNGLLAVSDLMVRFGGHKQAAGLTIKKTDFDILRKRLNEDNSFTEDELSRKIWVDVPVPCSYISEKLIDQLSLLEPFGPGNEKPVFADRGLTVTDMKIIGKTRNVLKLTLMNEKGYFFSGVMFGDADELHAKVRGISKATILYYPAINEYNGRRSIQFNIDLIRETGV